MESPTIKGISLNSLKSTYQDAYLAHDRSKKNADRRIKSRNVKLFFTLFFETRLTMYELIKLLEGNLRSAKHAEKKHILITLLQIVAAIMGSRKEQG